MLKKHGNKLLDYKNYFKIPRNSRKVEYRVDFWFFIPSNLHPQNYNNSDFFNDLSLYTRYNAPNLGLTSLVDLYNEKNPLYRLLNINHTQENREVLEYELKTLLNILKVSGKQTIETVKAMGKFSQYEAVRNLENSIQNYSLVVSKLISIYKDSPKEFSNIYLLAIEGATIRVEKILYKLHKTIPEKEETISLEIEKLREIRRRYNFSTIFTKNERDNSNTVYREHLIKKWSESIMYISNESSRTQKGLKHLIIGSAAAMAMLIVGIITLFTSRFLGEQTLLLFIGALLAYSLKDRIKDILKVILLKRATNVTSDRVRNIVDPGSRIKCGKSKESIYFPSFRDLPGKVRELRFKEREDLEIKQHQEEIIHYRREVKLNSRKLYTNHSRLFGIKEIMRFDLRRWFYKMDRVKEKCFIPENGKLVRVNGEREYHFSIIVRTISGIETITKRYSVIANSRKVKEIREVI